MEHYTGSNVVCTYSRYASTNANIGASFVLGAMGRPIALPLQHWAAGKI